MHSVVPKRSFMAKKPIAPNACDARRPCQNPARGHAWPGRAAPPQTGVAVRRARFRMIFFAVQVFIVFYFTLCNKSKH
jgi:hypothetical protein